MAISGDLRLTDLFNQPTPEEFWHHVAKTRKSAEFYQKRDELQRRMEQIRAQMGECSFDLSASTYRWAPLHVAVLSGNVTAVRFFLDQGARTDLRDAEGKTPFDLAKLRFPGPAGLWAEGIVLNLTQAAANARATGDTSDPFAVRIDYPPEPQSSTMDLFTALFVRRVVPPPLPLPQHFQYRGSTSDFGIAIKKLLFTVQPWQLQPLPLVIRRIIEDMKAIASKEGWVLTFTESPYYPRDHFTTTATGETLLMGVPGSDADYASMQLAIQRGFSKTVYAEEDGQFKCHLACLMGCVGTSAAAIRKVFSEYKRYIHAVEHPLYIECGNLFQLTNARGERKVLIGKNHEAQIHAQLRLGKRLSSTPPEEYRRDLPLELLKETAEEMYAMGLLILQEGTGLLSSQQCQDALIAFHRDERDKMSFREAAIKHRFIRPIRWDEALIKDVRPRVLRYLWEREQLPAYLASVFKVSPDAIHFIPQFTYHLDIFIKPGPRGSLFVQDFSTCIQLFDQILCNWVSLGLNPQEVAMVARYLDTAKDLEQRLGESLGQTREALQQAGFIVIPTPGIFYDQHFATNDPSYHCNFLNAVSGWSEKEQHYFYITTGVQVGERLGPLFMQIFTQFLKQYEPHLAVHFTGENPERKGDFSEAMNLWNQIEKEERLEAGPIAGIHCLSFELAAEDHSA